MSLRRIGLGEVKSYPLSDADIRKMLGDDISIMTYPDLNNIDDINDIFDAKGRCILLFLTSSPTAGHWCCLLNKKKGIEFFDPYGEAPEEQKDGAPAALLDQLNQRQPVLTDLMRKSGKPVFYNTFPFQKTESDVNTCGRHAVVRCLYAPYSLKKYKAIIDSSGMSPDDFVSGLTYDKLRK
jgi:hypothetical protein